jgi:hypothetical protein
VLPYIGVELVWVKSAVCSGSQCDLKRTLAGKGVLSGNGSQ